MATEVALLPDSEFSRTLRGLRGSAGYPSAYTFHDAFRRASRGACTYKAYADIEAGRALPRPELAAAIARMLGLELKPAGAAEFFRAYLRSKVADEGLANRLLHALAAPASGKDDLFVRAAESSFNESKHFLSLAQAQALREDPAAFCCFLRMAMGRYGSPWVPAEVVRSTGLTPKAVKGAMEKLIRVGLLKRVRGRFACPIAGGTLLYPRDGASVADNVARMRRNLSCLPACSAPPQGERALLAALGSDGIQPVLDRLSKALKTMVQGTGGMGPDTAVFLLEAAARRVGPR